MSAQPPFDPWLAAQALSDVTAASALNTQALSALQTQRLQRLLKAAQRSPLYRERMAGQDLASLQLQDLPIVHKAELMHRFSDWVTDPAVTLEALQRFTADPAQIGEPFLGRYTVWESSGSSGEPGIFIQDAAAMAVHDALECLRRPTLRPCQKLLDPWGLSDTLTFVGATGGHFASTVSVERLRRLNPVLALRLHSVSFLQPLRQLIAQLQAIQPTVLATYPSMAVLLAAEAQAGRLHLRLQEVWTGGENLSPGMRRFISDALGCPVANSYGASEFLSMASECRHDQLHLNSDWVLLEPIDAQGRPVPPGQMGESVLLTNLANLVQPLIRYELGDRITLHDQRCACGSVLPVIEVSGRHHDSLRVKAPGQRAVTLLPLAISTVLEEQAGLFDFQLVQQGPQDLMLHTGLRSAVSPDTVDRACAALAGFLAQQGAAGVRIHHRSSAQGAVPLGPSGKGQRVVPQPCPGLRR
jgi:phenylacetate-coenzyme A ligase PaaK-like adenylate-forming protein